MESGRFLSIEIVNTTIQQFIDNYDWSAIIAAYVNAHNANPTAHPSLGVVPCLYLALTNQSIPAAEETELSWETENLDAEGFWAPGDPTHINIPAAKTGLYIGTLFAWFHQGEVYGETEKVWIDIGVNVTTHAWTPGNNYAGLHVVTGLLWVTEATAGRCGCLQDVYDPLSMDKAEFSLARLKAI